MAQASGRRLANLLMGIMHLLTQAEAAVQRLPGGHVRRGNAYGRVHRLPGSNDVRLLPGAAPNCA